MPIPRYEYILTGKTRSRCVKPFWFGKERFITQVEVKVRAYDEFPSGRHYRGNGYTEWRDMVWNDLVILGNTFVALERK